MQDMFLRWAFGQLFGSKAKSYYDTKVAPIVDQVLAGGAHKPGEVLSNLLQSNLFTLSLDKLMTTLKINAAFKGIVEMMLTEWITAQVNNKFGK